MIYQSFLRWHLDSAQQTFSLNETSTPNFRWSEMLVSIYLPSNLLELTQSDLDSVWRFLLHFLLYTAMPVTFFSAHQPLIPLRLRYSKFEPETLDLRRMGFVIGQKDCFDLIFAYF
eukprot:TRINITY_DN43434_c0_g1_i1.p1 TRINITY_DN43434_c0_g1~~TRINITY_DN43434_c0_g1_i1.p1  ORF type:complete len:116 (+),score=6.80 TRINITY_DN43434_c0_g1_i1:3-350(+)